MKRTVFWGLLIMILFSLNGCDGVDQLDNERLIVTFDLDGGNIGGITSSIVIAVKPGSTIDNVPSPQRNNYIFDGWYSQKNGLGDEFSAATIINEDLIVYAKWLQDPRFDYFGTWKFVDAQTTLIVSANEVIVMFDSGSYRVSPINWVKANNNNPVSSTNFPTGYNVTGIVSEHSGSTLLQTGDSFGEGEAYYIHKGNKNIMIIQWTDDSTVSIFELYKIIL